MLDPAIPGVAVFLPRNSRQPGSPPVSNVFLADLLLLFAREPTPNALCALVTCQTREILLTVRRQIFSDTFNLLSQLAEEIEEDQEMLPLAQMGLMMTDWLDPTKTVYVVPLHSSSSPVRSSPCIVAC